MQLYGLRYPFAMRLRLFSAAVVIMYLSLVATAQEPAAVVTVRNSPGFHTAAEEQFRTYEASLSTHCAAVTPDWSTATHVVYGPPQIGADRNLINATWVETVSGTACGQLRHYRVLVVIRSGKARVISLMPGDGFAGPQLEHDAKLPLSGAVAAFIPKGQTCPVDVLDTHLAGAAPTAPKQTWNEIWTVSACGKRLTVPIQFVPDIVGEGTSIHIESKAVSPLP